MLISINGVPIQNKETLGDMFARTIKDTQQQLQELNRETRRSKSFVKICSAIAVLSTLCMSSVAKAESLDAVTASAPTDAIIPFIIDKLKDEVMYNPVHVEKENTLIWQLNEYMSKTLFTNYDFFNNTAVVDVYHTIWHIVLAFLVLLIGKKGFDMVKAHIIGANTQGTGEFIIRLLASCVMSFFTLDIMSVGIDLSNLATSTIMKSLAHGTQVFNGVMGASTAGVSSIFWMFGFIVMFTVIGVGYWVRQINMVILGCLAPVANMAWVTDGGSMLGTLIREFIVVLTTPIIQTLILAIGTVILMQVGTAGSVGFFNSILIGFSTMFVMIVTPTFLRKFTTDSVNPFSYATKTFLRMKTMPASFMSVLKK
jgi:hypothetical protein